MATDYDHKFEEMKKYIPFLENMIKRLESTGTTSGNPRQAQLAKIRSLRDLLLDKKKRMKMENLMKCEQVLINLYAKVEQRDSFSDIKKDTDLTAQKVHLGFSRSKHNATSHLQDLETLPEIARASQTEEACTAGSKEPALFQRRPNKASISPTRVSLTERESSSTSNIRSYTRVLVSPERDTEDWPQDMSPDKSFTKSPRRISKKSPRISSPPQHKRDKKQSSSQTREQSHLNDLNITLKVPEESLNSLNTKDILSRIINCNDNDVDIDTLRGLRTQILSELKQTGSKDDISDLILKSYKHKKKIGKKKEEFEEGELSDSESEIIESIYGSLVVIDKDPGSINDTKKEVENDQLHRKIQICLVINSEKESQNETVTVKDVPSQNTVIDESDFESFQGSTHKEKREITGNEEIIQPKENQQKILNEIKLSEISSEINAEITKRTENTKGSSMNSSEICEESKVNITSAELPDIFSPNFYKPVNQDATKKITDPNTNSSCPIPFNVQMKDTSTTDIKLLENPTKLKEQIEIPLLDLEATAKQEVVQEIDILQALKKEILSEKICLADSAIITPPLHQPKLTKVVNMEKMLTKKRISIEKYKEKSTSAPLTSLYTKELNINNTLKDELLRKQSLKLTDKEYERFNLSTKLALEEISDEDNKRKSSPLIEDIYGGLAPKSPDHEDFADAGIKPPVIIPADPIKAAVVSSKTDIDMRMLTILAHTKALKSGNNSQPSIVNTDKSFDVSKNETEPSEKRIPLLADPRVRRDFTNTNMESANLAQINFAPNVTTSRMPNMTPNRMSGVNQSANAITNIVPNMTPTTVYDMTPSRQSFDIDNFSNQGHIYAPVYPALEVYDPNDVIFNDGQNIGNFMHTMFNPSDCPQTPLHQFGKPECPPTPNHSFGRLEMPMTPIHTFGRSEVPMTPVHPFGITDCPSTPSHPFGRAEVLMTPTHSPFGRTEFSPNTLGPQIGGIRYNNFQDPRINRSSDFDNLCVYNDEKDCGKYNERNLSGFNPRNYKYDQPKRNYSDTNRNFDRQRSDKNATYEQVDYSERTSRRDSNNGRSTYRDYKSDRHYSNDRNKGYRSRDYRNDSESRNFNDSSGTRHNYRREHSVGRSFPEDKSTKKNDELDLKSDNTLSIELNAGRSLTIDTSVNRSFQETLSELKNEAIFDSNFDARRRRASSVGRSLGREKNVEKGPNDIKNKSDSSEPNSRFRRACSAGREITECDSKQKFMDIKEELQSYKHTYDTKASKDINKLSSNDCNQIAGDKRKKTNDRDPRFSRRDCNDQPSKSLIGERRGSRLRKEFQKDQQNKFNDLSRGNSFDNKKHGIDYSNDNIAKGVILGSGYGVKNYKIPKIKRAPEVISHGTLDNIKTDTSDDNDVKKSKNGNRETGSVKYEEMEDKKRFSEKNQVRSLAKPKDNEIKATSTQNIDKANNYESENEIANVGVRENVERRVTRSLKKTNLTLNDTHSHNLESPKRKVNRKSVLYDTDSDDDNIPVINICQHSKEKDKNTFEGPIEEDKKCVVLNNETIPSDFYASQRKNGEQVTTDKKPLETKTSKPSDNVVSKETLVHSVSGSNNCIEVELEMFSENIASDPVIDNINDLIADLDDDLETSKNQFTREITLENMLDNITCSKNQDFGNSDEEENISQESESCKNKTDVIIPVDGCSSLKKNIEVKRLITEVEKNNKSESSLGDKNEINDEVSTTENVFFTTLPLYKRTDDHVEICSTPDSTIQVSENAQEIIIPEKNADSTSELTCEMSSDITSTHNSDEYKGTGAINSPHTELSNKANSIESILSLLKDKSKIQQLLAMLKDQSSENEKLKKKLEMLSEIVSDDEDLPDTRSDSSKLDRKVFDKENEKNANYEVTNEHRPTEFKNTYNENTTNIREGSVDFTTNKNDIKTNVNNQSKRHEENIKEKESIEGEEKLEDLDQSMESKNNENEEINSIESDSPENNKKSSLKNIKSIKKNKTKLKNRKLMAAVKARLTKSDCTKFEIDKPPNVKKPNRELKQLQNDMKEMFLNGDIFNTNGIRMCRLAKLVEDKSSADKVEQQNIECNPDVVHQKIKRSDEETVSKGKTFKKKQALKSKSPQKLSQTHDDNKNENTNSEPNISTKCKPGPKSKTKVLEQQMAADVDPYMFESDSFSESNRTNVSENNFESSSDSECGSLKSSKSFESNEHLELKKKPKRKRRGWKAGVIKPKHKKKKIDNNSEVETSSETITQISLNSPDETCFTDKMYCFSRNVTDYSCRLCLLYRGNDIVHHYKKQHPHSEIPLSRMSPDVAKEAIEQCEDINFQTMSKIPTDKYVCRFCFKEFSKKKTVLEAFFWHVVSMHTGEYKQLCSECFNVKKCPFNLDIPPPPKELKGQLIGYICGKCNFTQISLENLKTHVINRHNDEKTEVYTVSLAVMSKKILSALTKSTVRFEPRILRSTRSIQYAAETNSVADIQSETLLQDDPQFTEVQTSNERKNIKSRITFENVEALEEESELNRMPSIKLEPTQEHEQLYTSQFKAFDDISSSNILKNALVGANVKDLPTTPDDISDYPHFQCNFTESGTKEYVCCINGVENHYRTALLISFKKHVQIKHNEKWDGFCFVCKVIVTPQGTHHFKDCLQHFLDMHIDNFPIMENCEQTKNFTNTNDIPKSFCDLESNKNYLNVRPLTELISQIDTEPPPTILPIIESVVSLGASTVVSQGSMINFSEIKDKQEEYKYEEAQADIMSKKNNVVLQIMMDHEKLVHIFKCAGRFCSYSTDNAEEALRHAITHERVGGENSMDCIYCNFNSSNNAVDLITHVFNVHGGSQFVCGHCFYRAAASQLVRAHALRLHPAVSTQSIILRTTITSRSDAVDNILRREIAVPSYICNQATKEGACAFRTYTSGKFCEHLQSRHQSDDSFLCFICSTKVTKVTDLVQHMKWHGYRLYQCTWCVHGADTEPELLAHAAERHPHKQPQAYLRVVTNKEGGVGLRVLPLAHLNSSKIATIDVMAGATKGNPEREAERSIDLEKLIGQTSKMIESMAASSTSRASDNGIEENNTNSPNAQNLSAEFSDEALDSKPTEKDKAELVTADGVPDVASMLPRPEARRASADQSINDDVMTPALKTEPDQNTPEKKGADVICLDSDDDTSGDAANLVAGQAAPAAGPSAASDNCQQIPVSRLYKCGVCPNFTLKNVQGYKRHLILHSHLERLPCAHCSYLGTKDNIVDHYKQSHSSFHVTRYVCGLCDNNYGSLALVRKHLKEEHAVSKLTVTSKLIKNGESQFIVGGESKKKKLFVFKMKQLEESPVKLKKFTPADIPQLPINPILDDLVYCALCEFSTKVRLNMVRHLQLHAEQQPASQTAPVNPVPHLETHEKHFDKMVNLASSSIASRLEKCNKSDKQPLLSSLVPPEAASQYPKFVPDRQRYTCGAKGCCYISVNEMMLKHHWEALHSTAIDFHCVHCPPYQQLDTSKPITASRINAHLKMHDARLYACSACPYYHYRRQALEKHILDLHNNTGTVMVVREEPTSSAPNPIQATVATPTMDLKPWQCGLCKFKSMLRQDVVEHCARAHQSKMQYKCSYCAFRTSAVENITKHQLKSHPEKPEETFYFYYREGSVPDEADGTPRWQKQRQKCSTAEPQVKTEKVESSDARNQSASSRNQAVNLNIVKREPEAAAAPDPAPRLTLAPAHLCEPQHLKYKCPLCTNVAEESKEAMQSHLYEELQHRKWGCGFCSYKGFHKTGINEHMISEHRQNREPIELPVDSSVEAWIAKVLDHQFLLIEKTKQNLSKEIDVDCPQNPVPSTSTPHAPAAPDAHENDNNYTKELLENSFGKFGASDHTHFSCPKCNINIKEENTMRDHLEIELNKIRWCCDSCPEKFQNYHEAQFHCKATHREKVARTVEAVRDAGMRAAWIAAVLSSQRAGMSYRGAEAGSHAGSPEADNSLLEVRYAERIATPEVYAPAARRASDSDEDEEKLVIDEPPRPEIKRCAFCGAAFNSFPEFRRHVARHTDIKAYFCSYCDFNGFRKSLWKHLREEHKELPVAMITMRQRANGPPLFSKPKTTSMVKGRQSELICLQCQRSVSEDDSETHVHDYTKPAFARKGQLVVQCCACTGLHESVVAARDHHAAAHPGDKLQFKYHKIGQKRYNTFVCEYCRQQFKCRKYLMRHWEACHSNQVLRYYIGQLDGSDADVVINLSDDEEVGGKRRRRERCGEPSEASAPKMCARKSTTKLPSQAVARKSTAKLPFLPGAESAQRGYSFYGSKPQVDDLDNIKTSMSFGTAAVSFSYRQLGEVLEINPTVLVEDVAK